MRQSMATPKNLLRVAIYIRVSSDEQAKSGDSIRDQQESAKEYIEKHDNMILQDIYIDDGVSGQKLDRDDFTRLMANVAASQVDLIVFTKLDRWFRSLRHYLNTQATLETYQVAWTAIHQPYFDTSTPYGRAFVAQSMTWAELEAQNGGMRVRDVFKNKVEHGEVITGKIPRGYKIQKKHLVPSDEAPIILDIFNEMKRTQSMSATLRYMRNSYGMVMTLTNLKESILTNQMYIGQYRGNSDFCPPLIPQDLFQEVQNIFQKRQNVKSGSRYSYIFSGLLICGHCGKKLSGCQIHVKTVKANGKVFRYKYPAYQCKQACRHLCVNGGEIRESTLETYLLEQICADLMSCSAVFTTGRRPTCHSRQKTSAIDGKLDRLKTLYINEFITLEEYQAEREEAERVYLEFQSRLQPPRDDSAMDELLKSDFNSIYLSFDNEEKRLFWRSIIKEIRITRSLNHCREYQPVFL